MTVESSICTESDLESSIGPICSSLQEDIVNSSHNPSVWVTEANACRATLLSEFMLMHWLT